MVLFHKPDIFRLLLIFSRNNYLSLSSKLAFILNYFISFLKGEALEEVLEVDDALGTTVERLQETYNGIKVYDTVVTIHKSKNGVLTGEASGEFIQDIAEDLADTEVHISDKETLHIALDKEGDDVNDAINVKYSKEIYLDDDNHARLVNIVSYLVEGVKRPVYIIDAKNGEILKHWQSLTTYPCCERKYNATGGNERAGKIIYGNMPYCLTPDIINGTCFLENDYVRVIDSDKSYWETAYFDCETGPEDEVNGAYSPAVDAFFYGTVVGKMFEEWFNSTPLIGIVLIKVHSGYDMENAYWDGEYCSFGDGYNRFYPFTELDIVAHEIGHGVTEFSSDLEYYGESGGINEAFSDIMGEAAENYLLKSDFMTGYSIMKTEPYLREFQRPERDNNSISHVDDMHSYMDVHYSSGIYRRIWYVVVKEEEMPIRDAFTVFLHANRMYWHETTSFYSASCDLLRAAIDLGYDTQPFRTAFEDVGISYCSSVADPKSRSSGVQNLYVNETINRVLVSETKKPRFMINTPLDCSNFYVDVERNSSKDVLISVMRDGWNTTCEGGAKLAAEEVNHVMIAECANNTFYIQLSLSDKPADDGCDEGSDVMVAITAGYTVPTEYESDDDDDYYDDNDDDYYYYYDDYR